MKTTHTYALLEVPATVHAAIKSLLLAAGYEHAIHEAAGPGDDAHIDMHGIALTPRKGSRVGADITVATLLSSRTKEGRVEFTINGEIVQMELSKAREVVDMLQDAIEAAVSDELMFKFLTTKIGLDENRASMAMLDFRELRQGSKGRVHPS